MAVGTSDDKDTLDTGESEALLAAMNLDNYKETYGGYTFFQSSVVEDNDAIFPLLPPSPTLRPSKFPPHQTHMKVPKISINPTAPYHMVHPNR